MRLGTNYTFAMDDINFQLEEQIFLYISDFGEIYRATFDRSDCDQIDKNESASSTEFKQKIRI